ncbi:SUMF1/EgtB/PvdO family nonheme iron enzyme [bacterium]|nr:SUMF1/EgtB/PvdO family nonheme iron enzyme [bacterium]
MRPNQEKDMTRFVLATAVAAHFALSVAPGGATADVFSTPDGIEPLGFVRVGAPGNAPDPSTGKGSVAYEFEIARFEVTNAQYAEFLNAVAVDGDPYGLWDPDMDGTFGYIQRAGTPGDFSYAVAAGRENQPVANVSFWDAARFVNWLQNGQGAGGTESGTYQMSGNGIIGGRSADAQYVLPTDDEWYKAAYFQPAADGGDADSYWLYPTASNTLLPNEDRGGANYFDDDGFFGGLDFEDGPFSPVGWYTEAPTYWGSFDQGGNVSEWVESMVAGSNRGIRGGNWQWTSSLLEPSGLASASGSYDEISLGFRVARLLLDTTSIEDRTPGVRDALAISVFPNPFNPQTTVAFTLPRAGNVRVAVFDLRGRSISTLVDGSRESGQHTVAWDGRDDAGQTVGSGVYLVRVVTPHGVASERALLVK